MTTSERTPTQWQIVLMCMEIRRNWSEAERRKRTVSGGNRHPPPYHRLGGHLYRPRRRNYSLRGDGSDA